MPNDMLWRTSNKSNNGMKILGRVGETNLTFRFMEAPDLSLFPQYFVKASTKDAFQISYDMGVKELVKMY